MPHGGFSFALHCHRHKQSRRSYVIRAISWITKSVTTVTIPLSTSVDLRRGLAWASTTIEIINSRRQIIIRLNQRHPSADTLFVVVRLRQLLI